MKGYCTIFWSSLSEEVSEDMLERQLRMLPQAMQKRLNKYSNPHDRYLSLLGKLLLFKALDQYKLKASEIFGNLQYTDKGRPYFENEAFDFNISHSSALIACAFSSNHRIGIDVQKIIPVSKRQAQFFVNIADLEVPDMSLESGKLIEVWTRKEAVSKVVGDGLSISFRKMLLNKDSYKIDHNEEIFIYPCTLKAGYSCSLASKGRLNKIDINFIPEEDLILKSLIQAP